MDAPFMDKLEKYISGETKLDIRIGSIESPEKRDSKDSLILHEFYIDRNERGNGKGTEILNEIKRLCKENGYKTIWAFVHPEYENGGVSQEDYLKWFEKRGFEIFDSDRTLKIRCILK